MSTSPHDRSRQRRLITNHNTDTPLASAGQAVLGSLGSGDYRNT